MTCPETRECFYWHLSFLVSDDLPHQSTVSKTGSMCERRIKIQAVGKLATDGQIQKNEPGSKICPHFVAQWLTKNYICVVIPQSCHVFQQLALCFCVCGSPQTPKHLCVSSSQSNSCSPKKTISWWPEASCHRCHATMVEASQGFRIGHCCACSWSSKCRKVPRITWHEVSLNASANVWCGLCCKIRRLSSLNHDFVIIACW